jgi:hypothetical protein
MELGHHIPDSIRNGSSSERDDTLLRSKPSMLGVTSDEAVEISHVGEDLLNVHANDTVGDLYNGRDDNLVSSANG